MRAIITLSRNEGDSRIAGDQAQYSGLTKSVISPFRLNRHRVNRAQKFFCVVIIIVSGRGNVFGLRTLGAIGNLHSHGLPLLQRFVTFGQDRTVMNENVFATFL